MLRATQQTMKIAAFSCRADFQSLSDNSEMRRRRIMPAKAGIHLEDCKSL